MTEASQIRATLQFRSDRGRQYLYDDITGNIFPWNELREEVLSSDISDTFAQQREVLHERYGISNVDATHRFIRHWRERYGAFVREVNQARELAPPPAAQLERQIRNGSFALILIVTEDCNLRCRYCALSEVYPLNRVRSTRRMKLETARRAIDWYVDLVSPQFKRNPRKRFGLSFYGGEPMMNMPVLRGALEY
jgi:uncharacterized protein